MILAVEPHLRLVLESQGRDPYAVILVVLKVGSQGGDPSEEILLR